MAEEIVYPGPLTGIRDVTPPDPNYPSSDRRNLPKWFNGTHLPEMSQRIIHPYGSESEMKANLSATAGTTQWAFTRDTATMWVSVGNDWVKVWSNGGGTWTNYTPKMYNWNSSTSEVTEITGGFSANGQYMMVGPKTVSFRFSVTLGNPGAFGENVFLFSGPFTFRNTQHGVGKIVHSGSTYGVTCQTNGNRDGLGQIAFIRGDGTGGGFYSRRTWGTGSANDWVNGDVFGASCSSWELA